MMISIDGSVGGGQILRSALSLSMVTQKPFRIERIRGARKRPGLLRQHLTAVLASQEICNAHVEGAQMGASAITFAPNLVVGGHYEFSIGTAGSASLVLQTILPALALTKVASRVVVRGGTHNSMAPPFEFLEHCFFPIINALGPNVTAELDSHGFYPAGGGQITTTIQPCRSLSAIDLIRRGEILQQEIVALVSNLPRNIGEREIQACCELLGWDTSLGHIEQVENGKGPGNVVCAKIKSESLTEVLTSFGAKGRPVQDVASELSAQVQSYLATDAPVGPHLADQLLLWMALAGQGRFRTGVLSDHFKTHLGVIKAFLDIEIECKEVSSGCWDILL